MAEIKEEVCQETTFEYINQMKEAISNGCGTYCKLADSHEEWTLEDQFECDFHKTTHDIKVVYVVNAYDGSSTWIYFDDVCILHGNE